MNERDEKDCRKNTDVEIWRKVKGDYYSPSIHVTQGGGIGMNVGGFVIVRPIEEWHRIVKHSLEEESRRTLRESEGKEGK